MRDNFGDIVEKKF